MIKTNYKGFTLLELLIVVIIVAVLAAVALPQYKHAALKSRFSAVMPIAKAVADANEVYHLGKGMYALSEQELDVESVAAGNTNITLNTEDEENKYAYVAAYRTDVPGVRYIVYQKHSPMFAENVHCEADENNPDALWLCSKGLQGTEIPGSINREQGDYKTFLLGGVVGTNDTLPTSLSKLARQLCGDSENCDYEIDTTANTVTLKSCIDYSDGNVFISCTNRTYAQDGSLLTEQQTLHICNNEKDTHGNYYYCRDSVTEAGVLLSSHQENCYSGWGGQMEDGKCVSTNVVVNGTKKYYYQLKDENNSEYTKECTAASNGRCTAEKIDATIRSADGTTAIRNQYCSGMANDDLSCSSYESAGNRAFTQYEIYNANKKMTGSWTCNAVNTSTGECTTIAGGYWNNYAADGTTLVGRTGVTINGDTLTFTKKNPSNEVISTATCLQSNADFEHGTCKPGTAIE